MSKKNSMVVFYFGDEQKSVKVTKKTSPKKLKQRLFDAFNIDSKHSIEGLANDNIYSLRGFLKNFDLRKPYHLILQKSGSKAKDSPNSEHRIRKHSPTFGNIKDLIDPGQDSGTSSTQNLATSLAFNDGTGLRSSDSGPSSRQAFNSREGSKVNIFSLMSTIQDLDSFIANTVSKNKHEKYIVFMFSLANPRPLEVSQNLINEYSDIKFFSYTVTDLEKHSKKFLLNPPLIATYMNGQMTTEISYSSSERQIASIVKCMRMGDHSDSDIQDTYTEEFDDEPMLPPRRGSQKQGQRRPKNSRHTKKNSMGGRASAQEYGLGKVVGGGRGSGGSAVNGHSLTTIPAEVIELSRGISFNPKQKKEIQEMRNGIEAANHQGQDILVYSQNSSQNLSSNSGANNNYQNYQQENNRPPKNQQRPDFSHHYHNEGYRLSIEEQSVMNKQNLFFRLSHLKPKIQDGLLSNEDYIKFLLYIQLSSTLSKFPFKVTISNDKFLEFLKKKRDDKSVQKLLKKRYKRVDYVELINLLQDLGMINQRENKEFRQQLEEELRAPNRQANPTHSYRAWIDQFVTGKVRLRRMVKKLKSVWRQKRAKKLDLKLSNLERPKSALPRAKTIEAFMMYKAPRYFDQAEIEVLRELLSAREEFLISSFELFQIDQNEAELVDTVKRIIRKFMGESTGQNSPEKSPEEPRESHFRENRNQGSNKKRGSYGSNGDYLRRDSNRRVMGDPHHNKREYIGSGMQVDSEGSYHQENDKSSITESQGQFEKKKVSIFSQNVGHRIKSNSENVTLKADLEQTKNNLFNKSSNIKSQRKRRDALKDSSEDEDEEISNLLSSRRTDSDSNNRLGIQKLATPNFLKVAKIQSNIKQSASPLTLDKIGENAEEQSPLPKKGTFVEFCLVSFDLGEKIGFWMRQLFNHEILLEDLKSKVFGECKNQFLQHYQSDVGINHLNMLFVDEMLMNKIFEPDYETGEVVSKQGVLQRVNSHFKQTSLGRGSPRSNAISSEKNSKCRSNQQLPMSKRMSPEQSGHNLAIPSTRSLNMHQKKVFNFGNNIHPKNLMNANSRQGIPNSSSPSNTSSKAVNFNCLIQRKNSKKKDRPKLRVKKVQEVDAMTEYEPSVISISKSMLSTNYDYEKRKTEVLDTLYQKDRNGKNGLQIVFDRLIVRCKKSNMDITNEQIYNLEEQFSSVYPPFYSILYRFLHHQDFEEVRTSIDEIKNTNPDAVTNITQNYRNRKEHVAVFCCLLNFLKNDEHRLNHSQYDLLTDLIMTENVFLVAAYELYLFNRDLEEFVDNLFLLYRTYYEGGQKFDTYQDETKQKQYHMLFQYKEEFLKVGKKYYNKLMDLIKCGDTKTNELYLQHMKDVKCRDKQKFIRELSSYARQALNREKEMKWKRNIKRNRRIEWQKEFQSLAMDVGKKIMIKEKLIIINAMSVYEDLAKSIYDVFSATEDVGDMEENIKLFLSQYMKEYVGVDEDDPFTNALRNKGVSSINLNKISQILEDEDHKLHRNLVDIKEVYEVTEDEDELMESIGLYIKCV